MQFGSSMFCPVCGSNNCVRSRRRSTMERVLSWIGVFPFRCHDCSHRFSRFYPSSRSENER